MLTEDQALARIKRDTAPSSDPELSEDDLRDCLTDTMRATVWVAGASYQYGDRVITGNGRMYSCVRAGTSGAAFPSGTTIVIGQPSLQDGGAVWKDAGPAFRELYDLRAATHLAWTRKAGKVAERITFSADGQRFELQQLHQNCVRMANRFVPVGVA